MNNKLYFYQEDRFENKILRQGSLTIPHGVDFGAVVALQNHLSELFDMHEVVSNWFLFSWKERKDRTFKFLWKRNNLNSNIYIYTIGQRSDFFGLVNQVTRQEIEQNRRKHSVNLKRSSGRDIGPYYFPS